MIKYIRLPFYMLVVLAVTFLGYFYFIKPYFITYDNEEIPIGGEFSLVNQDGQAVRSSNFKDKYMLIFFGFSSCKRICPMYLGIISEALAKLDDKTHNKLQTFFITVDPERDDVDKLKKFQQQFDHRIQMLTGARERIDEIMLKYRVYAAQVAGEEEINHSTIIYLIGPNGKYVTHFAFDLNSDEDHSDKIVIGIEKYIS